MAFDLIEFLGEVLIRPCRERGFLLLDPVSERHGSWEWTFYKRAHDLNRFVSVALTSLPAPIIPDEPWYEVTVEFWAGADNGNRFARRLIDDFRVSGISEFSDEAVRRLVMPLVRAMDVAERLQPTDLTEAYLPSRSEQGGDRK